MNQHYQELSEVLTYLKEKYVLIERTENLESLLEFQKDSILNRAEKEAEEMLFIDSGNNHMTEALIKVMEMSDEEVMESILQNLYQYQIERKEIL